MAKTIDFYFDFSSPYGYIASHKIDDLAARHGRVAIWRPFLLGAAFKLTGAGPFVDFPLKGAYGARDMARSARFYNVPFNMPEKFPINGLLASRAYYWLEENRPELAKPFAKAAFAAYFVAGRDLTDKNVVLDIASAQGCDRTALEQGMESAEIKTRLRDVNDEALRQGVFGSPFVLVDGEPFWGVDRFDMIDQWLSRGGW
jgi:2-hydroxychromene-2-carboxylate isomerase